MERTAPRATVRARRQNFSGHLPREVGSFQRQKAEVRPPHCGPRHPARRCNGWARQRCDRCAPCKPGEVDMGSRGANPVARRGAHPLAQQAWRAMERYRSCPTCGSVSSWRPVIAAAEPMAWSATPKRLGVTTTSASRTAVAGAAGVAPGRTEADPRASRRNGSGVGRIGADAATPGGEGKRASGLRRRLRTPACRRSPPRCVSCSPSHSSSLSPIHI